MIGVSSSTVRSIIARCSRSRSRNRASAPTALRRFPWISMTRFAFASSASARSSFRVSFAISSSRRSTGLRPRGRPSSFSAPSRCCLRQYVRCDVYSPSRRSSSPTSPGLVHASAFSRISSLYFAVNDRRLACKTSSGSGTPPGPPARRARRPRIPARLRLPGLRGRRQHHPQPWLHSCSSPTSWRCSVLALKVHRFLDGERLAGR